MSQGLIQSKHIDDIIKILLQAGEIAIRGWAGADIFYKKDLTPFTNVELSIESLVVHYLQTTFPDHHIITEENGNQGLASNILWALDPIDGTKAYLNGIPTWGISLGLLVDGEPRLGFFYMPRSGDLFWGGDGFGAFRNDTELPSGQSVSMEDHLAFLGVPANAHCHFEFDYRRLRSLGSTAAHLAYLAQGAALGVLTRRVNLWDLAGVLPLLEQTGVQVTYHSGRPFIIRDYLDGQRLPEELLAARPDVIELLRAGIHRKK